MSEERGYRVIVKLNLPPVAQYASGNSVILQGDTVAEVKQLIAQVAGVEDAEVGQTVLNHFGEAALKQAVVDTIKRDKAQAAAVRKSKRAVETTKDPTASEEANTGEAQEQAPATSSEAPPSSDPPASEALMKVLAKKSGKSPEELGELTTSAAKALLAELKGGK
jgi:hypothetical protein